MNANYADARAAPARNDNSGRARGRELLTKEPAGIFGRTQNCSTEEEADAKTPRRFMSMNLAKPIETDRALTCTCSAPGRPSPTSPNITSYRVYDDRVGDTYAFRLRFQT